MRSFVLLTLVLALSFADTNAQKRAKYTINPGEKIIEKLPRNEVYTYPEFTSGKVYLKNNTVSLVRLNYNSLYAEMQFINPKGDTLSVSDEKLIRLIIIDK